MRKTIILGGVALAAITAVPIALAAMPTAMSMSETWKRADVEAKVKEHFAKADGNNDGAVTREEIGAASQAMRGEKFGAMFDRLDSNKDGAISRDEFIAGHSGPGRGHDHHRGDEAGPATGAAHKGGMMKRGMLGGRMFERADANKDGKLTLAEANGAALAWFDRLDSNKDGQVTAQERIAHWQARRGERKAD